MFREMIRMSPRMAGTETCVTPWPVRAIDLSSTLASARGSAAWSGELEMVKTWAWLEFILAGRRCGQA